MSPSLPPNEDPNSNETGGNSQENHIGERLGKIFMLWAIALFAVMFIANHFLDQRNNPNQHIDSHLNTHGQTELELQQNAYGHYVASGEINGEPVTFLLDTGATHVSIPEALTKRLNLTRGRPQRVSTANGIIEVYATDIQQIRLGDIELNNIRGNINPFMDDSDEILLGMSFLKHLEITQTGARLILRY